MKQKILALSLLAALLAQTACGSGSGTADTTVADPNETTTEAVTTSYLDTLPEEDLKGYEFRVIGQNYAGRQNFYLEEKEGDVINDSLYARDSAVAERLNLTLTYISVEDRGQLTTTVQNTILADDEAYDLLMQSLSSGINTWTGAGLLYDLKTIPYLSLESTLWNKSMYDNMQFNGKLYFTTGAVSPIYYQTPIVMVMNKRLAEDYKVGDIYKTVLDGDWTVELLHSLTKDISTDLNNDGKMDENDFYGLVVDGTFGNVLYNSAGLNPIDKNYQIRLGDAASVDVVEKLAAMFGSRDVVFNDAGGSGSSATVFRNGNGLFMDYTVLGVMNFRDLEDDFAIIPSPKYDGSQETYNTTCNTWLASGVAVPINCSNPERTGLVMETMAYYSSELIVPAVYEVTLRGKVSRDDESSLMLDIIYENSYFDMITAFNFAESAVLLREMVLGERENFVSGYESIKNAAQAALDTIVEGTNG